MHGAPPVQLACGRDRRWSLASEALGATAAAVALHWLLAQVGVSGAVVWPGVVTIVLLGWRWSVRSRSGREASLLTWDGHAWSLDGRPGEVVIAIDLGPWLLLRFHDPVASRVTWLPLPLPAAGAPIAACRAALYAHAGAGSTMQDADASRSSGA